VGEIVPGVSLDSLEFLEAGVVGLFHSSEGHGAVACVFLFPYTLGKGAVVLNAFLGFGCVGIGSNDCQSCTSLRTRFGEIDILMMS
jgi:hypothetical protein